jgi:RPA family protein
MAGKNLQRKQWRFKTRQQTFERIKTMNAFESWKAWRERKLNDYVPEIVNPESVAVEDDNYQSQEMDRNYIPEAIIPLAVLCIGVAAICALWFYR